MRFSKKIALMVVLILAVSIISPTIAWAEEKQQSTLNLQEALDIAQNNDLDYRKSNLLLDAAQINLDLSGKSVQNIPRDGLVMPAYQQVVSTYQQNLINLEKSKKNKADEAERISNEVITAYSNVLKSKNSMENALLALQDLKEQKKISSLSKAIGMMSNYDYSKLETGIKQAEENYHSAQVGYQNAMAFLRELLGVSKDWQAELITKPVIGKYDRNSLDIEISRGIDDSVALWVARATVNNEQIKQRWANEDSSYEVNELKKINLNTAEINFEQTKRSIQTRIEQLYYTLDTLEGQIEAAELAYETAQDTLKNSQLKYDLGLIPQYSASAGSESIAAAQLAAQKARINMENARLDLVAKKAEFAYLTGKTVYEPKDWE